MNVGCGGNARDDVGGGARHDQGSEGSDHVERKWSDLEASMKAIKDAVVKENKEKSARIRQLMEENVRLEQKVLHLENSSAFQRSTKSRPAVQSRLDPFVVFPPEVWEYIIGKMNRYSDLEILCLAFPQLEPLVKKLYRNIFLFEKVFPLMFKRLERKDINNCRLVCEKWNQDLCAHMANAYIPNPVWRERTFPFEIPFITGLPFTNHENIENFLTKMSDHPGNPIFGRRLHFKVFARTNLEKFWPSALKLVKKFGQHVWSFRVSAYLIYCNVIDFHKVLQQLLLQLPNLRDLTVNYSTRRSGQSEIDMNLAAQFWNSPLPPLPYLQSLKLGLNSETGLINAFIPYFSNQIYNLEFIGETLANVNLKAESLRGFINLKCLEVEFRSAKDVLHLLKFPTANLKKMCLYGEHCPSTPDPDSISSEQFASLSEKFIKLEHLDLRWCGGEISSFLGSNIQFLGLKTLKIKVGIGQDDLKNNLDFLLWIPSLKHLVMQIVYSNAVSNIDDYDKYSALKVRKYLLNYEILESNVWTLIPSLELLEVRGRRSRLEYGYLNGKEVFSRKMFENYRMG